MNSSGSRLIIWQKFLDWLLPKECLGCGARDELLCSFCLSLIRPFPNTTCPFCQTPSALGRPCPRHQTAALDGLLAAGSYHDPLLQQAISFFKYQGLLSLNQLLGGLLVRTALTFKHLLPTTGLIIPLPRLPYRERIYGLNQSLFLAENLAQALERPLLARTLIRRYTLWDLIMPAHAQLGPDDPTRWHSLRQAFRVTDPPALIHQPVILVDDVSTSGSSLEMAARALKKNGATQVFGLVLARA